VGSIFFFSPQNQVYKSAIQFQFREPATADSQQMDSYEGQAGGSGGGGAGGPAGETGEDISSEAKESGPGLLELSKPSEFRLRALKQQKYLTFNKGSQGVAFAALLASGEKSGLGLLVSS